MHVNYTVFPDTIPDELKALDRWGRSEKGSKKPLLNNRTLVGWKPFDQATAHITPGKAIDHCIGLVLIGLDGFVFIDLDACAVDKAIQPWAQEILDRFPSTYTEWSPSGMGLRLVYSTPEKVADRGSTKIPGQSPINGKLPGFEVYGGEEGKGQWITMTGNALDYPPEDVAEIDLEALSWLLEKYPKNYRRLEGDVEAGDMPDLVDAIPSVVQGDLSAEPWAFWSEGEHGDRSELMFWIAVELVQRWGKETTLALMWDNTHCREAALDHRRQDEDAALLFIWENCIKPAINKHQVTKVAEAFEELEPIDRLAEAAKREEQAARSNLIPTVRFVSPAEALERFIYVKSQDGVFDILHPRCPLKINTFRNCYAGSKVPRPGKQPEPVTKLWLENLNRKTTDTLTFRPGYPIITQAPKAGGMGANTWRAPDREGEAGDPSLFLEHVQYLFKDRADDFLDWLAHIEQKPGELPHRGWLHISSRTGTGRNWMASVLVRVWWSYVSPNQELGKLLNDPFNEAFGEALLIIIDEIKEGGHDTWTNSEKFTQAVNPELREINRKYGLKSFEWNCARWLLFSNHLEALPLTDNDRRLEVVINEDDPHGPEYYQRLYTALKDPAFILGVARFLGSRDISGFDPGGRSKETEDRSRAIGASRSDLELKIMDLIENWPSEVITANRMAMELGREFNRGIGVLMRRHGAEPMSTRPLIEGKRLRLWALRNAIRWREAPIAEAIDEIAQEETML